MQTQILTSGVNEFTAPSTSNFHSGSFTNLVHTITHNTSEEKIDKFGEYVCEIDFSHQDVSKKVKDKNNIERTLIGGIDTRLRSIINFQPKVAGLNLMYDALRNKKKDTSFLISAKNQFKKRLDEIKEEMGLRSRPVCFTGGIKHKTSGGQYLEKAVAMVVELDNEMLFIAKIGEYEYEFKFTTEANSKSGLMKAHKTVYPQASSEQCFDGDNWEDDEESTKIPNRVSVESNLEVAFQVRQPVETKLVILSEIKQGNDKCITVAQLPDDLKTVLASLDDEFEQMMIEEDARKQRFNINRNSYAGAI
ncbi:hypothetical protein [Vibrio splendidus]|uniref:hypothetical protein n=1 Tax=Vibrio splendidus TaxID=29497 RepID=UPI00076A2800|nr:hypothetical protein [Vibrio splendidus]PHX03785.1 hypothetical protein VSPL_48050 [Vibrio splendidus]